MSSINFDNAYLLLIAIPIVALLAVPFFLAVRKENANAHNIASGVMHLIMAICIAFALAGTTIETTVTETNVYVLVDVSYSSQKNLDTIDNYIDELSANLPKNSKMGVVCFAKEQQMLVPLGKSLRSVKGADTDILVDSETDIESALDYASTLFRDDVIKRVVLMTDGKQTHVQDSNALKRAVDTLRAEGIFVDAVYVDNNISDDAKEVQMVSAVATQNTYFGKQEEATVTIRSTFETRATVSLYRGDLKLEDKPVKLEKGNTTLAFDLITNAKGSYDYEVIVTAEGDENKLNNNAKFSQTVSDSVSVLLITENEQDIADIEGFYGDNASVSTYNPNDELPSGIEQLCAYDEIVISNADLTKSRDSVLFLDNLEKVVSTFGKSLVTYGNVYTHDKEDLDALANMLPVRFGNADRDSKLYTIVIDASRSMETLSRLNIAKSAGKQLISKLNEGDMACVVAFNGNYYTICSPEEIYDTPRGGESVSSRQRMLNAIDGIEAEHGTVISFGLQEAFNKIKGLNFGEKQVMLISDGLTVENVGSDGVPEDQKIKQVLNDMKKNRIAVSVIDVGRGADTGSSAEAAEKRLKDIATLTGGTYAFASTMAELEDVVFAEGIFDELTAVVIDEPAAIQIARSSDSVLNGVEFVSTDYVTGFIYNKVKSGSTTVLELNYDDRNVPLYAYWNYGNGRVATFAATLENVSHWDNSRLSEPFFDNVLATNIPTQKASYPFTVETVEENGYINITVTPSKVSNSATMKIKLTTPGESENAPSETLETTMTFATSCYKYSFATYNVGKYEVEIQYVDVGRPSYSANYSYHVAFLPEYDSFATYDPATLHKMIGAEGTVMKGDDVIRVVNDENMIASYVLNLTLPLLIACVVLFVTDVIVRKIKWEDIRSLFGKGRK